MFFFFCHTRSERGGSEKTVVAYALLFTVEVTREMLLKVALTVLHMEEVAQILIGDRNFTLTDHTGIFRTATTALASTDGNKNDHLRTLKIM